MFTASGKGNRHLHTDDVPQNGPIRITTDGSWEANPFSWNTLADIVWIDQPVGKCSIRIVVIWFVTDRLGRYRLLDLGNARIQQVYRPQSYFASFNVAFYSLQRGSDGGGLRQSPNLSLLDFISHPLTHRRQLGFLANFISVFPSLAIRPLYLIGESYAGTFIVSVDNEIEVWRQEPNVNAAALHRQTYFLCAEPCSQSA